MKLATVAKVRDTIRFESLDDINTSIGIALEVASIQLESELRTDFSRETRYDIFYLKHETIGFQMYSYNWRLSSGFVDSGETFTVKVADQISDFSGSASQYETITSDCITKYDLGLVSHVDGRLDDITISGTTGRIIGNFVRVDYTKGFESGDGEHYDSVPTWLEELAAMKAIIHLDTILPDLRHAAESPPDIKSMKFIADTMVAKHIRYFPKYDNPVVKT